MFYLFYYKKKTDRSNIIIIESARVRGSKKEMEEIIFSCFLKMVRIQLLGLSWAGHSTR